MFLIVGLGNPGMQYERTRHNAGAFVLKAVCAEQNFSTPSDSMQYESLVVRDEWDSKPVCVAFPQTYMNLSGRAVKKILAGEGIEPKSLVVLYDDIDLPLGTLKVSFGRGAGGHNGVESIISSLGTKDFIRIRIGIAPKTLFGTIRRPVGDKLAEFVLGRLSGKEEQAMCGLVSRVTKLLTLIINEGMEAAMQEGNRST